MTADSDSLARIELAQLGLVSRVDRIEAAIAPMGPALSSLVALATKDDARKEDALRRQLDREDAEERRRRRRHPGYWWSSSMTIISGNTRIERPSLVVGETTHIFLRPTDFALALREVPGGEYQEDTLIVPVVCSGSGVFDALTGEWSPG